MHQIRRRLLLVFVVAVAGVAPACSKDGDEKSAPSKTTGSTSGNAAATTAPPPLPTLALTVSGVESNGTTAPDDATIAGVKQTLDGWLATAVVAPLHSGAPAADLAPYFTVAALERLADPAVRASLVDEGLPPATKAITPEVANVLLSAAAGADGIVGVVVGRLDLKLRATGANSDVDIVHQGDLVLVFDNEAWRIDSFQMHTTRDSRP